jgi:CPA2 family monovalent cation:H+ antiporter-2
MVTNGIVLLATVLLSINFLVPLVNENVADETLRAAIVLVIPLGVAAPFFWAFMAQRPNNHTYKQLWLERKYNRGPLLIIEITRTILGLFFLIFWVYWMAPTIVAIILAVSITLLVMLVFSRRIQRLYHRIESGFLTNLNARATEENNSLSAALLGKNAEIQSNLEPWDAHIVQMKVNPDAGYIGKTLQELAWREQFGINIVYIKRGERLVQAPGRDMRLMPFDQLGIIATDMQIQAFKPAFDSLETGSQDQPKIADISLQKIIVDEHTKLKGKDIRNSGLRERTNGIVVGIERNNQRILNPDSGLKLEWGDIIWIVGERKKIQQLEKSKD